MEIKVELTAPRDRPINKYMGAPDTEVRKDKSNCQETNAMTAWK